MTKLSWLHLSDLRMGPRGSPWLWPENKDLFERDLRRLHIQTGPWDLVLISGDLTQTGSVREFNFLQTALVSFWDYLRSLGSNPLLLAVPGGRDLHLGNLSSGQRFMLQGEPGQGMSAWPPNDFWGEPDSIPRRALQQAFSPFAAWLESWREKQLPAAGVHWQPGLLPGDFAVTVVKDGFRLGIAGLNSDFRLPDVSGEPSFRIDARQLSTLRGGGLDAWSRSHDLNLLLTHSPPERLESKSLSELKKDLGAYAGGMLHLCGMREDAPSRYSKTKPSPRGLLIQAPSLFGTEAESVPAGYVVGQLEISEQTVDLQILTRMIHSKGAMKELVGNTRTIRLQRASPRVRLNDPDMSRARPIPPPAALPPPAAFSPPTALGLEAFERSPEPPSAVQRLPLLDTREHRVSKLAWSSSGKDLVLGMSSGWLFHWTPGADEARWGRKAHVSQLVDVCCAPDGREIATRSAYNLRFWAVEDGTPSRRALPPSKAEATCLAWSSRGMLSVGFNDGSVQLIGKEGDKNPIWKPDSTWVCITCLAWSSDGQWLACGDLAAREICLLNPEGETVHVLKGRGRRSRENTSHPLDLSWQPGTTRLAVARGDTALEILDPKMIGYLEIRGHKDAILGVSFSHDGRLLASKSRNGVILIHRTDTWDVVATLEEPTPDLEDASAQLRFSPTEDVLASVAPRGEGVRLWLIDTNALLGQSAPVQAVHSVSAKVVLVGEGRAGKSCLALRLLEDRYEELDSTHAMRIWNLPLERIAPEAIPASQERREIILWDMGGQSEYQLVHQLFFRDTAAALMVMEPARGKPARDELEGWNRRVTAQAGTVAPPRKLLVGTKVDHEHVPEDQPAIEQLLRQCGFAPDAYISTSAKTGRGLSRLKAQLASAIDWSSFARSSHPALFERIQRYIQGLRESRRVVITLPELEHELRASQPEAADPEALRAVVEQLGRQGLLADTRLADGTHALVLEIEQVERYANSLIVAARENPNGVPAVDMAAFSLARRLPRIRPEERLRRDQEVMVLDCVVELLLQHGICLLHQGLLVFPSLFVHAPSDSGAGPTHAASVAYEFSGPIDNIYAALVAAVALSRGFGPMRLWEDRAEFGEPGQDISGLRKVQHADQQARGLVRLEVYFEAGVSVFRRKLFKDFIATQLREQNITFEERLAVVCVCGHVFSEQIVDQRRAKGFQDIICSTCEQRTSLTPGSKDPALNRALQELRTGTQRQRNQSVTETKVSMKEAQTVILQDVPLRILHLSDLHVGASVDPMTLFQPLVSDLIDPSDLAVDKLDYLVISGDITNRASPEEFKKALEFVAALRERFELSADRCIIVPGNHDLNWDTQVYDWRPRRQVDVKKLSEGSYKEEGVGYQVRDDKKYPERFKNFSEHFHHPLLLKEYPLDTERQCVPTLFPDTRLQFLAMNSSWEVDEHFPDRSHIHEGALSHGLLAAGRQLDQARQSGQIAPGEQVLKLAVWHHPITGNEKIQRDAFMGKLRQAGVRLVLHGHVHENRADLVGYTDQAKQIHVIGAGSFGAPTYHRPESVPRLYNLMEVARDHSWVRVHTRALRSQEGAWEGWAVWPGANKGERRTSYEFKLR